jgi:hypothetical protein
MEEVALDDEKEGSPKVMEKVEERNEELSSEDENE